MTVVKLGFHRHPRLAIGELDDGSQDSPGQPPPEKEGIATTMPDAAAPGVLVMQDRPRKHRVPFSMTTRVHDDAAVASMIRA
jgi:hypothetical protein